MFSARRAPLYRAIENLCQWAAPVFDRTPNQLTVRTHCTTAIQDMDDALLITAAAILENKDVDKRNELLKALNAKLTRIDSIFNLLHKRSDVWTDPDTNEQVKSSSRILTKKQFETYVTKMYKIRQQADWWLHSNDGN